MKFKASERALSIQYAIRDILLPAMELEKKGIEVLKLNIGDPNKYGFDTPAHIKEAVKDALDKGAGSYSDSQGDLELREAIVQAEKRKGKTVDPADIVVTTGVSEGIMFLFAATLKEGDNVLIPGPGYPPYIADAKVLGAEPRFYKTIEEEGWQPDVDDIRKKIDEKTKAVVLINPNNPTGALYPKDTIREICDIVGENNLFLVSDEIYDEMVYDEKHCSPSTLSDIPMVIFNGISKVHLAPGWRVGYAIFRGDELSEVKEAVMKQARTRLSANTPCQKGAIEAFAGPQGHIQETVEILKERRDFAYKRLNEIDGISTQKPGGAFYIFPKIENVKDDKKFVLDVLNKAHVLFVHGSGFGKYGEGHFRSVFLPPLETLERAFDALEKFMGSNP